MYERKGSTGDAAGERIRAAFAAVERARFLPPDTPAALAAADTTVPLGPPGINNGQPSLHAACLAWLDPQPEELALHIGAGSGYYTAILARLCRAVVAYEVNPELAAWARRNVAGLPGVRVENRCGAAAPLPPADIIYVNCGAPGAQPAWREALRPGGRLLFPRTGEDGTGRMVLMTRGSGDGGWRERPLMAVAFVPCELG